MKTETTFEPIKKFTYMEMIRDVERIVCSIYGIIPQELKIPDRSRNKVECKTIISLICRKKGIPSRYIADNFNQKYSGIVQTTNSFKTKMNWDKELKNRYEYAEDMVYENNSANCDHKFTVYVSEQDRVVQICDKCDHIKRLN